MAAGLAAGGREVVLLRAGAAADPAPEVPVDTGLLSVAPDDPRATEALGPLVNFVPTRGILVDGRIAPLPMGVAGLVRLFSVSEQPRVVQALAQARGRMALAALIGGGREQRSYADWVLQHYGAPVHARLHAPYARKRWGPPEDIVCGVARTHHGPVAPNAVTVPAEGWGAVARRIAARVETRAVAEVRGITAAGIDTDAGLVAGAPWVDLPPHQLLPLLSDLDPTEIAHHVTRMHFRHGVEVIVRGGARLPFETHVVDAALPFYRVVRTGLLPGTLHPDTLVVQFAVDDGPAWAAADADFVDAAVSGLTAAGVVVDAASARVRRLPFFHPVWSTAHLVRLRHWLLFLEESGVVPIGRAGLASPVDPGTVLRWLAGRVDDPPIELRELGRQLLEPAVLDPVERPHLRDFIVA